MVKIISGLVDPDGKYRQFSVPNRLRNHQLFTQTALNGNDASPPGNFIIGKVVEPSLPLLAFIDLQTNQYGLG
jgi:hypothetical protein